MTRGFLLGKFLPPHAGHRYLCDVAASLCDRLTVLVCSLDSEPVPGALRHAWMRELCPGANVLHCVQDLPQEPVDHPDFWPIWREVVRRFHPEPVDVVFASEAYGARLADEVGARFIPVDPGRRARPVSGSAIRAAPFAHWDFIAAPARPWFTRVVSLHGPESTGKTTLAERLAAHFRTCLAPEYGRTYTEVFGVDCDRGDLVRIAQGQAASILAARNQARGLVVSDTDPVLTAVWSDMLTGGRDPWFEKPGPPADLYLLTDIDGPWVDDGTRYFPEPAARRDFFERCEAELRVRSLPYRRLSGNADSRFAAALAAIHEAFPGIEALSLATDRPLTTTGPR